MKIRSHRGKTEYVLCAASFQGVGHLVFVTKESLGSGRKKVAEGGL